MCFRKNISLSSYQHFLYSNITTHFSAFSNDILQIFPCFSPCFCIFFPIFGKTLGANMTSTVPSSCKAPSARNAASMPNERHRKRKKNTASTCLRCFSAPKRSVSYKSKAALGLGSWTAQQRSTSANHAARFALAFLGRFRIRAVAQSPASFGLGSWTAQQGDKPQA